MNVAKKTTDSMQFYRHMDIGSAKIRPEEMCVVPHYLIDVLDPSEEFHVVKFVELAQEAMEKISVLLLKMEFIHLRLNKCD